MSSTGVDLVNLLAILAAGRVPVWTKIANPSALDTSDVGGISTDIGDGPALVAWVYMRAGATLGCRTADLTLSTLDLTATYAVSVNTGSGPTTATYDAAAGTAADRAEVIEGIRAACAGAFTGYTVTAIDTDDDAAVDTVRIVGPLGSAYAIQVEADGTGAILATVDAATVEGTLLVKPGGTGVNAPISGEWAMPVGGNLKIEGPFPRPIERYVVAGMSRVQFIARAIADDNDAATGPSAIAVASPSVWIGLGGREGRTP